MSTDEPNPAAVAMRDVAISIDRALDQLTQLKDMEDAIYRSLIAQLRILRNRALDDAAWQPPRLELVRDPDGWLTYPEAAARANRSTRTIKRWVQTGRLQAHNGQTKPEWVDRAVTFDGGAR